MTARPWRAAAFAGQYTGAPQLARTSAKTEAGLARFLRHWRECGATVVRWQVQPIPEVERITQGAPSAVR